MVRAAALIPLLILGACDDAPRPHSEAEIADIARFEADRANIEQNDQLAAMGARIDALESQLANERKVNDAVAETLGKVSDQVARNAEIANENTLQTATENGECGTELIRSNGRIENRKIPCTAENYFSKKN